MTKLDEVAVNIELVLITVIESIALVFLAQHAVAALNDPEWYSYITYILAGLTILFVFWTQSILHVLTFARWPVRMEHLFAYFACALVQMIAYTNILSLPTWFMWWGIFSVLVMGLYVIDLWILRDSYPSFSKQVGGERFLEQVEKRHLFEMKYLLPAAFLFNIFIWLTALVFPHLFDDPWIYAIPGLIQFGFAAFALYICMINFHIRSKMIEQLFTEKNQSKENDRGISTAV
jgi:hypothetical protein